MSDWQRINDHTIQRGSWRITKSFVDGATLYALWRVGELSARGYYESAEDAKESAK